jgi:hypothetical protein
VGVAAQGRAADEHEQGQTDLHDRARDRKEQRREHEQERRRGEEQQPEHEVQPGVEVRERHASAPCLHRHATFDVRAPCRHQLRAAVGVFARAVLDQQRARIRTAHV